MSPEAKNLPRESREPAKIRNIRELGEHELRRLADLMTQVVNEEVTPDDWPLIEKKAELLLKKRIVENLQQGKKVAKVVIAFKRKKEREQANKTPERE